jgi:hypothetical protein
MTNRYAIIENGVAVNVVIADAEYAAQQGWIACSDAGPNWKYDGTNFTEPDPIPVPEVVTPPAPTKEQLMAELSALTAKIQALE